MIELKNDLHDWAKQILSKVINSLFLTASFMSIFFFFSIFSIVLWLAGVLGFRASIQNLWTFKMEEQKSGTCRQ